MSERNKMKIPTVNVIETIDSIPQQIVSFKDGKKGNKEAETLFTKMAKENGEKNCDVEADLEEGIYTSGSYNVCLVHSS